MVGWLLFGLAGLLVMKAIANSVEPEIVTPRPLGEGDGGNALPGFSRDTVDVSVDVPGGEGAEGGLAWARSIPNKPGSGREKAIFDAVVRGFYVDPTWIQVDYDKDGHTVTFVVAADALRIGVPGDSVRICCNQETAQRIADHLGARLPTTRMCDGVWLKAGVRIGPVLLPSDASMGDTTRIIEASQEIEAKARAAGWTPDVLLRNCGKYWINTEQLLQANGKLAQPRDANGSPVPGPPASANFGFYTKSATSLSPGGLPVIQSIGLRHNIQHVDYSQECQLFGESCVIDGEVRTVTDVLLDPGSAYLLSDEVVKGTPCRVTRLPSLPKNTAA